MFFFGRVISGRDNAFYQLPMKRVVRDLLLSGELPLWNRLFAAGQPLAANPAYELFYPPQLLVLLPDFILGFHLQILIHLAIAAIGTYALIRHLGGRPAASFVGAFSFAMGGMMLSFTQLGAFLFATSWLPWVLLFASRFSRNARIRDAALAALALAMQVLIGEPIVFLQTCALLLLCALVTPSRKRDVVATLAIVIAAVLVGAVQLLPGIDFARDTVRGIPLPYATVAAWSFPPIRPVELFFPAFAGRTSNDGVLYFGGHLLYGRPMPFLYSIYLGLLIAVAALAGVLRRLSGWSVAGGIIAASYVLALGSHLPLLKIFYDLHVASSVRYPEKWFIGAVFVIAVFGALSLQRMVDGDVRLLRTAVVCAAAVAGVACIAWAWTLLPDYPGAFTRMWELAGRADASVLAQMARQDWLFAFLRAAVLALAIALLRSRRDLAVALLICFSVVDLVPRAGQVLRRDDRALFEPPPILRQLPPPGRLGRVYNDAAIDRVVFRSAAFRPDEQYWIRRNGLYPFYPALWRQETVLEPDVDRTLLLNTTVFNQLAMAARFRNDPNFPRLFLDFAGVDTLLTTVDERAELARAVTPAQAVAARVIRFRPLPRYWFASRVETVRSPADVDARLHDGRVPRGTAFAPVALAGAASGAVLGARETATEAIVDVASQGVGFLVASVTFHRYWQVTIDRTPARIIPTNLWFQGVIVPPGRHQVRFTDRNPLVTVGAIVSLIALVGLVAAVARRT